jgi:transcriptional regulator with XRE-family HTH domain
MELSFGARLRAQRERQQVTLEAIAEQSKIRQPLLEALERDDVSHWPGGIFGRSYLRSYAHAIGLDPEATVREFLALHPDPEDEQAAVAAAATAADNGDAARPPRMRLRFLIESAVSAIPHSLFSSEHKVEPGKSDAAPTSITPRAIVSPAPPAAAAPAQESAALHDEPAPVVDLAGMAIACQRLAQAHTLRDVESALAGGAAALGATGLVLWMWDAKNAALMASLAHGYARELLARLPPVRLDADNAIASAFRSGAMRIVERNGTGTGAVVVPLMTPEAAIGALALEFERGAERHPHVSALATILSAQLSTLLEFPAVARSATA